MSGWIFAMLAHGATLSVPSQYPTLSDAVGAASPGDLIEIDASLKSPEFDTEVLIQADLTIRGINGKPELPLLQIEAASVTIEQAAVWTQASLLGPYTPGLHAIESNVTLIGCDFRSDPYGIGFYEAGAIWADFTDLTLDTVTVSGLGSTVYAVTALSGSLDIVDSTFSDNLTSAIGSVDSSITVENSTFSDNVAIGGSAIDVVGLDVPVAVTIVDSTFTNGTNLIGGGALNLWDASLTIDNSVFEGNSALGGGGAIYVTGSTDDPADVVISNSTFTGNLSTDSGGAIALTDAVGSLVNVTFEDNESLKGGAMWLATGVWSLQETQFHRNSALLNGGSLYLTPATESETSTTTVTDSVIDCGGEDKLAPLSGGGVYLSGGASASFQRTSISSCTAELGGGIAHLGTELALDEVDLIGNTAVSGGALRGDLGAVSMFKTRVQGNTAELGAALWLELADFDMEHTTLVGNIATTGSVLYANTTNSLTMGHNLICENQNDSDGATVLLRPDNGLTHRVHNNVFVGNRADLGAALLLDRFVIDDFTVPLTQIHNNNFIDNEVSAALLLRDTPVDLRNNIIEGHPIGVVLDQGSDLLTGGYNLYNQNGSPAEGGAGVLPGSGAVLDLDPEFQGYSPGDCYSNFMLTATSPARDSGDPLLLDPDGTVSDIGAFGGPDSSLTDLDDDGWWSDLDCDDEDPSIQECSPPQPCDKDADGFESPACGGDDCNDDDPSVFPGAEERVDDGIDQNCDGFLGTSWISGGGACGCTQSAPSHAPLAALMGMLLMRRKP